MERCKNGCEGKSWKWVIYEGYTGDMGYRDIWDLRNIWNTRECIGDVRII